MLDAILNYLGDYKSWLLYLIVILGSLILLFIYIKKYYTYGLIQENENVQLNGDIQQLKMDINKLRINSQQLNSKINDINTHVKYGKIATPDVQNHQLPFTIECMQETPFYSMLGAHIFSNIVDDDITPTNKPGEDITMTMTDHISEGVQIEEMSEPESESHESQMANEDAQDDSISINNDQASLVSRDFVLDKEGEPIPESRIKEIPRRTGILQAFQSSMKAMAEKPMAEKPTAEKPTAEKPMAEKPTAEKPTAEKPTAEKPTAEKPTAEKPMEKSTAEKSMMEKSPSGKMTGEEVNERGPQERPKKNKLGIIKKNQNNI